MTNGTQSPELSNSGQIHIEQCYRLPDFEFYNADSLLKMQELKSETINCILIDPPYKYLKNQKLEVDFDETIFFNEAKRVLKDDGFIVMFGRGTSFYRWNFMLSELGFIFKEEMIWDKSYCTSPLMAISRVHETVSIHSKNKGSINKVKVPYLEMKGHDISAIITDIKRLKTAFNNTKSLNAVLEYLENNVLDKSDKWGTSTTISSNITKADRQVSTIQSIKDGLNEKSIIRTDRYNSGVFSKHDIISDERKSGNRVVDVLNSVTQGMNEKTIIKQRRDHYETIHPTQKPVRLLERLLALTTKEGDLVLDAFAGSCSTGHACLNAKRKFIGYEIDREYYEKAVERIKSV